MKTVAFLLSLLLVADAYVQSKYEAQTCVRKITGFRNATNNRKMSLLEPQ